MPIQLFGEVAVWEGEGPAWYSFRTSHGQKINERVFVPEDRDFNLPHRATPDRRAEAELYVCALCLRA